jgi:hypothetical protein
MSHENINGKIPEKGIDQKGDSVRWNRCAISSLV